MRKQKARERRTTLLVMGGLFAFVAIVAVLAIRPGVLVPVTDASYGSSVGRAISGGGGTCEDMPESDQLSCAVETDPGSGAGGTMILSRKARGCWTARWAKGDGEPIAGCVSIRDLLLPKEPGGGLY